MKPVRYSKSDAQVGDELLKSLESQGRWKLFSGQGDPVFSQTELAHIIATAKDCKEDFVRLVTPRFCELMKLEATGQMRLVNSEKVAWLRTPGGEQFLSKARLVCYVWVFLETPRPETRHDGKRYPISVWTTGSLGFTGWSEWDYSSEDGKAQ